MHDPYLIPDDGLADMVAVSRILAGESAFGGFPTPSTQLERSMVVMALISRGLDAAEVDDWMQKYAGEPARVKVAA